MKNPMTSHNTAPAARVGKGRSASMQDLREQVLSALERLSEQRVFVNPGGSTEVKDMETNVQLLSEVLAGMDDVHAEFLPAGGAGFGSTVVLRDLDRQTQATYTLMTGPMLDIDANHVSLESPIGRALIGRNAGDEVVIETPQRRMRVRIEAVLTLQQRVAIEAQDHRVLRV
jgi:transcription elongation factor GreA